MLKGIGKLINAACRQKVLELIAEAKAAAALPVSSHLSWAEGLFSRGTVFTANS